MKNTTPIVLSILLLALIITGCSDSNSSTTSAGDGATGDLYGTVGLVDYRGHLIDDKSGVLIHCEGTSFSTVSASDGSWVIHNLPTRNYSIAFSKDGFSTYKNTSYQYIGGNAQRVALLWLYQPCRFTMIIDGFIIPKSDTNITIDSAGGHFTNHIIRAGAVYSHTSDDAPAFADLYTYYLFGRSESMSPEDTSSYVFRIAAYTSLKGSADGQADFANTLGYNYFSKFQPGERVFVKAYPYIYLTSYYDVRTGSNFISGGYGKESNVLSAVMQ
jgi:hypothetical protein